MPKFPDWLIFHLRRHREKNATQGPLVAPSARWCTANRAIHPARTWPFAEVKTQCCRQLRTAAWSEEARRKAEEINLQQEGSACTSTNNSSCQSFFAVIRPAACGAQLTQPCAQTLTGQSGHPVLSGGAQGYAKSSRLNKALPVGRSQRKQPAVRKAATSPPNLDRP
jgi:hypothetical protein